MAKVCTGCMTSKPLEAFGKHSMGAGGLRSRCRDCLSGEAKKWQAVGIQRRAALKQWAVDYLGGACTSCGYNRCLKALEFHHVNPNTKDRDPCKVFGTAKLTASRKEIMTVELDKCILLCSNCHREVHALPLTKESS